MTRIQLGNSLCGSLGCIYIFWLGIVTLSLATPAQGQVVRGRITDGLSGRPVLEATVQVLNPDSSVRALALTDHNGGFVMRPPTGTFLLRVDRLGFATVWSRPLTLTATDTLNFEVRLPRSAITLESLNVVAVPSGKLDPSGFYRRQKWGWGKFIGPEAVAKIRPTQIADLLNGTVGFFSYPSPRGFLTRMENRGRFCSPTVYLDGGLAARGSATPVLGGRGRGTGTNLDEIVNASRVRAVELYEDPGEAPVELHATPESDCGVIALWTYVGFGN